MAAINVRSGRFTFGEHQAERDAAEPLKVLIIGNFAGTAERSLPYGYRKHLRIDQDCFDDVFTRSGVSLRLPYSPDVLRFRSFDELHPDYLYDNIPLFLRYQSLKKQLRSPDRCSDAMAALRAENLGPASSESAEVAEPTPSTNLLDSLIEGRTAPRSTKSSIDDLIRQAIAPYLQPKPHPQTEEYVQAVDEAVSHVMREIMHNSEFRNLEARWRSVDMLLRRLDLDRRVHLSILDATDQELLADFAEAEKYQHALKILQNIRDKSAAAYDVLLLDTIIGDDENSLKILSIAMEVAAETGAVLLLGGAAELAGYADFSLAHERVFAHQSGWFHLRSKEPAQQVFVAAPRYMVRMPYGKKTAAIDSFAFEELPEPGAHEFYLWGNSAYVLLLAMCGEQAGGSTENVIENVALHAYQDEEGDSAVTPSTEFYLPQSAVQVLENAGFTVLQSVRNTNHVRLFNWNSMAAR